MVKIVNSAKILSMAHIITRLKLKAAKYKIDYKKRRKEQGNEIPP